MKPDSEYTLNAKQPAGLYILAFSELWDRFSYYGLQSLLVLYLIKVFLFSDDNAYTLFGAYTGLTFATPMLGGLLADRFLGFFRTSLIGAMLIIVSNVFLIFANPTLLYLGLAGYICGVGLFKPNNASLVGTLYQEHDIRRGSGFTLFYIAMNAGGLLGPAVYGFVAARYGWNYGFAVSAAGMFIGLMLLIMKAGLLTARQPKIKHSPAKRFKFLKINVDQIIYAGILLAVLLVSLLLNKPILFKSLLIMTGALTLIGLIILSTRSLPQDRNRIIALAILSFFCIFYFACSLQLATSLTLFIEREINRNVLGWQIPTAMFLSLQPLFIILTAPFLAKLWLRLAARKREPSIPMKIALGLVLAGISFIIFAMGAQNLNEVSKIPLITILVGNWALGTGELCLVPVMLTAISQLAPAKMHGTFMGIFFLSQAFSSYIASAIAKLINVTPAHVVNIDVASNYVHGFLRLSYFILGVGLLAVLCTPWLKRMLHEKDV